MVKVSLNLWSTLFLPHSSGLPEVLLVSVGWPVRHPIQPEHFSLHTPSCYLAGVLQQVFRILVPMTWVGSEHHKVYTPVAPAEGSLGFYRVTCLSSLPASAMPTPMGCFGNYTQVASFL